jgi:hypothetical protein
MNSSKLEIDPVKRELLDHYLAALAYRTQKALKGAPPEFGEFRATPGVRSPAELVRHMTSVLGYARTFFTGGTFWPDELPTFADEIARFHNMLEELGQCFRSGRPCELTAEQLLQGPLSDAMTHAGQLAMLRRMSGMPVPPENFIYARMSSDNLGIDQPEPASPDKVWNEAPDDWAPPE